MKCDLYGVIFCRTFYMTEESYRVAVGFSAVVLFKMSVRFHFEVPVHTSRCIISSFKDPPGYCAPTKLSYGKHIASNLIYHYPFTVYFAYSTSIGCRYNDFVLRTAAEQCGWIEVSIFT